MLGERLGEFLTSILTLLAFFWHVVNLNLVHEVRAMKKRVFVIHGWGADPASGWKPWLKSELEKKGFEVIMPQMPNTENPVMGEWVGTLAALVGKPDGNTYLVGHSLGVVTILRYLETLKGKEKIGGAVLVAGLAMEMGIPELKNFFPTPSYNWESIRKHCKKFITINSDNDYYIPLSHGEEFRDKLGAEMIVMHNHGHFRSGEGFTELPVLLQSVLKAAGAGR